MMNYFILLTQNVIDDDLLDIPSLGGFLNFFKNIFEGIKDSLFSLGNALKTGVIGIGRFCIALSDSVEYIENLTEHDLVGLGDNAININAYIGNIRFMTGDIVFTQIYFLLMIGLGVMVFQVITKLVSGINYLVHNTLKLTNIVNPIGSIWTKIKSIF